MSIHTCGQKPNDDGRIISACEGCNDRAEAEGAYLATGVANEKWQKQMEAIARGWCDPLKIEDSTVMLQAWNDARRLMAAVDVIARGIQDEANRQFTQAKEAIHDGTGTEGPSGPAPEDSPPSC